MRVLFPIISPAGLSELQAKQKYGAGSQSGASRLASLQRFKCWFLPRSKSSQPVFEGLDRLPWRRLTDAVLVCRGLDDFSEKLFVLDLDPGFLKNTTIL
jgi:hypothetical protein